MKTPTGLTTDEIIANVDSAIIDEIGDCNTIIGIRQDACMILHYAKQYAETPNCDKRINELINSIIRKSIRLGKITAKL